MSKSQRILSYASSHNAARSRRLEQVPQLSPQQSTQGSLVKTFKQYITCFSLIRESMLFDNFLYTWFGSKVPYLLD